MYMIKINNVEFDIDVLDLMFIDKYEEELERYNKKYNELKEKEFPSEIKRAIAMCREIFVLFDNVLGEGSSTKLFGKRVNPLECFGVLAELTTIMCGAKEEQEKKNERIYKAMNKYLPKNGNK